MNTLLAALITGVFAFAHSPSLAQEKKAEPTKEELTKAAANKADTKKVEGKKKVKKGGC